MTPAAIVAAINSLSGFDFSRLLESPDFWDAVRRDSPLLEDADTDEIIDELDAAS